MVCLDDFDENSLKTESAVSSSSGVSTSNSVEARKTAAPSNVAADDEDEEITGQINGTRVNLRESPSMNARVLYNFPGWEYVEVISMTQAQQGKYPWYKVSYGNVTGWVYGQFLKVYVADRD